MGLQPLMSPYQQYIFKSRYARWVDNKNRREEWNETVQRYVSWFAPRVPKGQEGVLAEIEEAIYQMHVMPSMRAMATAGPALERDNCAGYNCAYIAVDDIRAFDEAMYISMCGTGVGFSVERQYIQQLPIVAEHFYPTQTTIKVRDSRIGWATGLRQLISLLYGGLIPEWDLSAVRPAGALLKTMGGRASGSEPLDMLFRFAVGVFKSAAGRKLTSVECHDLMCMIGNIVVTGGVRRSAMLSLSNLSDLRMANAKNGEWWRDTGYRRLANNSVAYTEKPEPEIFIKEFLTLIESHSGERGIFNRVAATNAAKKTNRRKWEEVEFGCNPCGEINLRSKGLCNLTEVVVRPHDTVGEIKEKIRLAVIMGCLQATLTDFRYLRREWKTNAEEERLLGVSLTGIMDNDMMSNNSGELWQTLDSLRGYAVAEATEWAGKMEMAIPAAVTCVKPSGTVSQLVDSSSGLHRRFAPYILRAVREDRKSPISTFLKDSGIACEPEAAAPNDVDVFYFPLAHEEANHQNMSALDQLELYLAYRVHWTEHNPSCTVYVKDQEWTDVMAWVYRNFDNIGGVTFLPYTNNIYKQAPYRELSKDEYLKLSEKQPVVDWSRLKEYEHGDTTLPVAELACSAAGCELL